MSVSTDVAIIGSGPYGLSIASHLRQQGIDFRIFGKPMQSWRLAMPKDMFLKSEGFASDLYDPRRRHTLQQFYAESGLPYADYNCPISVETFADYGLRFRQQQVPDLDTRSVVGLDRVLAGFHIQLEDGETLSARRAIVATGVTYFGHVPEPLTHLPTDVLSHSSEHRDLSCFRGQNVSVIGGGASAIDIVASLRNAGAEPRLVARRSSLRWNTPVYRPVWKQWYPVSGLGGGWQNRFYQHAPMLFRRLPAERRTKIVRSWLGPAGAWPVRESVEQAELFLGHKLKAAKMNSSRVHLHVVDANGREHDLLTDHIIAATGYKVDLRKLPFLSTKLQSEMQSVEQMPTLDANFESSVPGLFFVGLASANTFGPVMRFLLGARYTARRLTKRLATGGSH